ncbi:uroporphyrinogen-III synthase [Phenylobacterium sp. LjRoot225]|uniref:uroporphyrinogen-III synthase n=1 Tax=Phenylobacterium sp. LjRoot225 TaxID=3342285 RepID=UPI003ED0845A
MSQSPLRDARIVVPESRELDLFTSMLEKLGARVVRCPLILVRDIEETTELDGWIGRLSQGQYDSIIFYTGEGVTRIWAAAERLGLQSAVFDALGKARKIARGPKPIAALRKLGLGVDLVAEQPTTAGVLALLPTLALEGTRIGVQLYPDADEAALRTALEAAGAVFDPVLPYQYVSDEADERVALVIGEMSAGRVDLIAFTSSPQVRRLTEVAQRLGLTAELARAFEKTKIAAVGPLTADAVGLAGGQTAIQPLSNFHLKPLVAEIVRTLGS